MLSNIRTSFYYRIYFVLVVALAGLVSSQAAASVMVIGSYEIAIARSERVLNALDMYGLGSNEYEQIQMAESIDTPSNRVRARNKPAVLIQNAESSEGDLTSFTMRIKQDAYVYGAGGDSSLDGFDEYIKHSVYTDPGVDIMGSSVSSDDQTITVDFNGLSAGKAVIFRVDLDVNPDPIYGDLFPLPDFRSVLFDAPEVGTTEHTSVTTATFSSGDMNATTPETPLIANPNWDMEWEGGPSDVDPIIPGFGGGTTVPEPTSLSLLVWAGLMGVAVWRQAATKSNGPPR